MKKQDCEAILRSIEQAIAICDQSPGVMDDFHRQICRELRATKLRLLSFIESKAD
jgi:hypothetical protein